MTRQSYCSNLNHARSNVSIKYCPECGKPFSNSSQKKTCGDEFHAAQRKNRAHFCHECGIQLSSR